MVGECYSILSPSIPSTPSTHPPSLPIYLSCVSGLPLLSSIYNSLVAHSVASLTVKQLVWHLQVPPLETYLTIIPSGQLYIPSISAPSIPLSYPSHPSCNPTQPSGNYSNQPPYFPSVYPISSCHRMYRALPPLIQSHRHLSSCQSSIRKQHHHWRLTIQSNPCIIQPPSPSPLIRGCM